MRQVPFAISSDEQRGRGNTHARLVNYYAEAEPVNAKSPVSLIPTPGTELVAAISGKPIVALHLFGDVIYAITKENVALIDEDDKVTIIGSVRLGDEVRTSDNGQQIVIVDGESGYSIDGNVVTEIDDPAFYPANTTDFIDGYLVFDRKGTGQFFISKLNSIDFDALDYATAEGSPDNTVGLIVDHREVWIFGERTGEIWFNTGAADFPLERHDGAFIERGCASHMTLAKADNSVFWVGDDLIVYRATGYSPMRISTSAVEKDLESYGAAGSRAYTYSQEGHTFYVLTLPSANKTWALDLSTGLWAERATAISESVKDCYQKESYGRHLANCAVTRNGVTYVGDYRKGYVYKYVMGHDKDDKQSIMRMATSPPYHGNRKWQIIKELEIEIAWLCDAPKKIDDCNECDQIDEVNPHQIRLDWTDDGANWKGARYKNLEWLGETNKRKRFRQMGRFLSRSFRLVTNAPVAILGVYLDL